MDDFPVLNNNSRSPSVSSLDTSCSSWSFVDDNVECSFDLDGKRVFELSESESSWHGKTRAAFDFEDSSGDSTDDGNDGDDNDIEYVLRLSDSECQQQENGAVEFEGEAELVENEGESDGDDDDISMVYEEEVLVDSTARQYVDARKVSRQLDRLSRSMDSPFYRIWESFLPLERIIRIIILIFVAAIAVTVFYPSCGMRESNTLESASLESKSEVSDPGEDFLFDRQCSAWMSALRSSTEAPLKSSFSPSSSPSSDRPPPLPPPVQPPPVSDPSSWVLNSEDHRLLSEKRVQIATNQCDRVHDEFSEMNEAVQRYVRHTEALKKLSEREDSTLMLPETDVNETLNDAEKRESPSSGEKTQEEWQMVLTDSSVDGKEQGGDPDWGELLYDLGYIEAPKPVLVKAWKLRDPSLSDTSALKSTVPVLPQAVDGSIFSFKAETEKPELQQPQILHVRRKMAKEAGDKKKIPEDLRPSEKPHISEGSRLLEKQRIEELPVNGKKDAKLLGEKRPQPWHANDSNAFFVNSKLPEANPESRASGKFWQWDSRKEHMLHLQQQSAGKMFKGLMPSPPRTLSSESFIDNLPKLSPYISNRSQEHAIKAVSVLKKVISKSVERANAHRDELVRNFRKAIDNITGQRKQTKISLSPGNVNRKQHASTVCKNQCIRNSTCTALANLGRALATIRLFPIIVGEENAAKYIDSILDLSACTDMRLVCEKCWWTKESCPKERCTFLSWQRHFKTKRFLISQRDKMTEPFTELQWPMPKKKHKGDYDQLNFEPDHPSRPVGSKKKMCPKKKKSSLSDDWYSERSGGTLENHRVFRRKTGVYS